MHDAARRFLDYVSRTFGIFYHGRILDVGSGDINGNNRIYSEPPVSPRGTEYVGCDVYPGKNVTVVSPCHLLPYPSESFDVIISSECFEHDPFYRESFGKIQEMLKPGGLFVFTCASTGRPEHGTRRTSSAADNLAVNMSVAEWPDYYQNLSESDIGPLLASTCWDYTRFYVNPWSCDLYFVGVRTGAGVLPYIPSFDVIYPGYSFREK